MRRVPAIVVIGASVLMVGSVAAQRGGRGTPIPPGTECPAGTTEIRLNTCLSPEFSPPSIVDYRPVSTLKVAEHKVPRAKFPAVDFHGHPGARISTPEALAALAPVLDELNVRLMVAAENMSGERLRATVAAVQASPAMRDRVRVFAGIDLRDVGPGWGARAVAQLEADVQAGATGIGEIGKGFGLTARKADGSRLAIDDRELDPVWEAAARLDLPVFIHTADPPEFFKPLDFRNERWLELALFADRRYGPGTGAPAFEQLMTERDNLFRRHPRTTFVAAHMGWHTSDLARLGGMLDAMPNVYVELGAVLYDIGRQPRAAREFFVKYQDRILFGKDAFQPEEYPYYWRVLETSDDYFDYYRPYHAFWKLYGIDLPDAVLKKVYYQNALRITRRLPQAGWPQ